MSKEYTKKCSRCQADIKMSDFSGKWLALEMDGATLHKCLNKNGNDDKDKEKLTVQPPTQTQIPERFTNDDKIRALESRVSKLELWIKRFSESAVMNL